MDRQNLNTNSDAFDTSVWGHLDSSVETNTFNFSEKKSAKELLPQPQYEDNCNFWTPQYGDIKIQVFNVKKSHYIGKTKPQYEDSWILSTPHYEDILMQA